MIESIQKIINVGTFFRFVPEKPVALRELTLIYGPNGTGKTTLGAILRSLARDDPDILKGRKTLKEKAPSCVEIRLSDGGACVWDGERWHGPKPPIDIFDEQFIKDNLYTDVVDIDHKRSLYRVILGEEPTRVANTIEKLNTESRDSQSQITALEKSLKGNIPSGMSIQDFLNLPYDSDIQAKIDNQEKLVRALQDTEVIQKEDAFRPLSLPVLPASLEALLDCSLEKVEHDAEAILSEHLAKCGMGEESRDWLERGLTYVREGVCPFCGQSLAGVRLIKAYQTVFSEVYRSQKQKIETERKKIEESFGSAAVSAIDAELARWRERASFWKKYLSGDWAAIETMPDWRPVWENFRKLALEALDAKGKAPLEAIPSELVGQALKDLAAVFEELNKRNEIVAALNSEIDKLKRTVSTDEIEQEKHKLQRLETVRKRHQPDVAEVCNTIKDLRAQKKHIEKQKEERRKELEKTATNLLRTCETRVNALLKTFNAGFRIREIKEVYAGGEPAVGWQIEIRDELVDVGHAKTPLSKPSFKNTLSAGDRSALAFAFFLAQLELKPDLSERIVVLDDPFTSQDSFRRQKTIRLIARLTRRVAQCVVASHDDGFLDELQDKTRRLHVGSESCRISFFQIRVSHALGAKIVDMDLPLVRGVTARADREDLQAYLKEPKGNLRDIIRKIRPVLEHAFRSAFPRKVGGKDMLGKIIAKVKKGELGEDAKKWKEELDDLNEYTRVFHHAEDPEMGEWPDIDPKELEAHVKTTLEIVADLERDEEREEEATAST